MEFNTMAKSGLSPRKAVATPKKKIGRPSVYSQKLAMDICSQISTGNHLNAICKQDNMPTRTTVYKWLETNPTFADMYVRAREERTDLMADEIIDIADQTFEDAAAVMKARLRVDTRKWLMAKMSPRKYGDKIQQEITGDVDVSLRVKFE